MVRGQTGSSEFNGNKTRIFIRQKKGGTIWVSMTIWVFVTNCVIERFRIEGID